MFVPFDITLYIRVDDVDWAFEKFDDSKIRLQLILRCVPVSSHSSSAECNRYYC